MKTPRVLRLRPGDDVRAVWLGALLIFCAGCYFIETHFQEPISSAQAATETLYRRTAANERLLSEQKALRQVELRAESDLQHTARDQPLWTSTAELLATLERLGAAHRVTIESIEPETQPAENPETDAGLTGTGLLLRVRGRFKDVLAFVDALSQGRMLMGVTDTDLTLVPAGTANANPHLDAAIHATLYRLTMTNPPENENASDR